MPFKLDRTILSSVIGHKTLVLRNQSEHLLLRPTLLRRRRQDSVC